jgi:hypothetical protein
MWAWRLELGTAGGKENGAAAVDDAADRGRGHGDEIALHEAAKTAAHPDHIDPVIDSAAHHGADRGVHAGAVAAAGEQRDALDGALGSTTAHLNSVLISW